jgi:hypothetical protein
MTTRLQKLAHLALLLLAAAVMFSLSSCKTTTCAAYSYAPMQPVFKQTWNGNQKAKTVKKKTQHYAFKKKPSKAAKVWANLVTLNGWN